VNYLPYKQNLKTLSRGLRKNLTDAEKLLWLRVRRKQIKNRQFFRQKPIGEYVVDFYCKDCRLVIEVDGGQHYEDKNIIKDQNREQYLKGLGLKIMRFSNIDVSKNINSVMDKIYKEL